MCVCGTYVLSLCSVSELLMGELDSSSLLSVPPTEKSRVSVCVCVRERDFWRMTKIFETQDFYAISCFNYLVEVLCLAFTNLFVIILSY